jgi:CubicO group peptidase (beta-lactamase class C family)
MAEKFNYLRTIAVKAVADGVVPGLAVLVGEGGETRFQEAFGQRQNEGLEGPAPATADTLWDLASLTKALVTSVLAMRAVERGALALDGALGSELAALDPGAAAIVPRQLLSHSAGFPAHRPLYAEVLGPGGDGAGRPEIRRAVIERAARTPLEYQPGTRSIYSDLGFILLGALIEARLGARLDQLAAGEIFGLVGARDLGFLPIGAEEDGDRAWAAGRPVAATERCPVRGRLLAGEVHDLNAYAMGGVAGHAGLFGTAAAVATVAHALCAAWRGGAPADGGRPLVERDVLRAFWAPAGVPGSAWRLGWDGPSPHGSLAGDLIHRRAVGHLAFTGCSLWLDPERETFVLVLANRIHPVVREDPRFRELRRHLNDAALGDLGYRA